MFDRGEVEPVVFDAGDFLFGQADGCPGFGFRLFAGPLVAGFVFVKLFDGRVEVAPLDLMTLGRLSDFVLHALVTVRGLGDALDRLAGNPGRAGYDSPLAVDSDGRAADALAFVRFVRSDCNPPFAGRLVPLGKSGADRVNKGIPATDRNRAGVAYAGGRGGKWRNHGSGSEGVVIDPRNLPRPAINRLALPDG